MYTMPSLVSPNTYDVICEKRAALIDKKRFCFNKRSLLERALNNMGDVESWWAEHPELTARIMAIPNSCEREEEIARLSSEGIARISAAWTNLQRFDFSKGVPLEAVIETGHLVDPNNQHPYVVDIPFRMTSAYNALSVAGSNAESVDRDVKRTLAVVNESGLNELEKGIFLHLNLARIQPFREGNKRTARLLQRRMFYDAQLPQTPLFAGERQLYVGLMNEALEAQVPLDHQLLDLYKSHMYGVIDEKEYVQGMNDAFCHHLKSSNLLTYRRFFDFMASKVNSAQDLLIR